MTLDGITVNFPKWAIWVTDLASWVTNIVLQYRGNRYAHCLYSIKIHDTQGRGYAVSACVAFSSGSPTGLGLNTSLTLPLPGQLGGGGGGGGKN